MTDRMDMGPRDTNREPAMEDANDRGKKKKKKKKKRGRNFKFG